MIQGLVVWLVGVTGLQHQNKPTLPLSASGRGGFSFCSLFQICSCFYSSVLVLVVHSFFTFLLCLVSFYVFPLFCILSVCVFVFWGDWPPAAADQRQPNVAPTSQCVSDKRLTFVFRLAKTLDVQRCTRNVAFHLFVRLQQGISGFRKYTQTEQ